MSKRLLDQRWPWLLAVAVIVAAFLSTVIEINLPVGDPRPVGTAEDIARLSERKDLNVLYILIDTLRAGRLGTYGYERDTSPVIDGLAREGVRFARHMSQSSWTKCSMASLWTSLYPQRSGITRFDDVLPDEALMPAEIFTKAGFRTISIYRNGWVAPNFGFSQGFETYIRPTPKPVPPSVRHDNPTLAVRGTDESAVTTALEFLRVRGREKPWLLYLHLMDLHEYTYDEETALFGGSYSDIYDNSIRWTDRVVGLMLEHLVAEGYRENTLVVINSDHGEAFRERGSEGHARDVYPETTEVPFILSFPFRLEPGVVVEERTRNIDVWPTILDLVGLEAAPGIDGRSLVPDLLAAAHGETPSPPKSDSFAIAHLDQNWGRRGRPPRPTVAVTDGRFRYVRVNAPNGQRVEQLFDSQRDPRELEDRSEEELDTFEGLQKVADDYLQSEPPWEAPKREMGEMELNQLRALGYALP